MELEHRDALRAAVKTLDRLGIEHLLFGANAQNVWGDPRYTKDVDFVLLLEDARFSEFLTAASAAGFAVEPDRHLDRLRTSRMGKLALGKIYVDFVLGETDFDRSAMARRRRVDYLDTSLWVASPEDLILYKLIAHRSRDLADIESVIRRQWADLDRSYLRKWARWLADNTGLERIRTTLRTMLARFGKKR